MKRFSGRSGQTENGTGDSNRREFFNSGRPCASEERGRKMSKEIGTTYELLEKIGTGGGGTIYLANHLRLGKKVVLKADKRKITTRPELLRREVDILKELRHAYIPQVYDYFIEDGVVYTVMDFIEGESLDKPLRRGERFSQPQVVKWAKQILEALCYLHSPTHGDPPRGYVHSDIKPANLMRTPYDDICLIDFNIALALGEDNVVGRSAGYASPEHYGLDYSMVGGARTDYGTETTEMDETKTLTDHTETMTLPEQKYSTVYKKIRPDTRSDIYSVGATLYHLLSGRRPAKFAREVVPLSEKEFSPQVVKIITKAMDPNPDLRYQTADAMLHDFIHLRENDPRTKRLQRRNKIMFAATAILFCVGVASSFVGLKRMQALESGLKLAEYSRKALARGDRNAAVQYALDAIPEKASIVTPAGGSEAQKALTDALGVYDLADGFRRQGNIKLQKNPLNLVIAPDGMTAACLCEGEVVLVNTETEETIARLPAVDSASAEVEYLDHDTVIYAGESGITAYSISKKNVIWTGKPATAISVSHDGSTVAALYKEDPGAVIYDAGSGEITAEVDFQGKNQDVSMVSDSFANPNNRLFEISGDGTLLAVSFGDGSLSIFHVSDGAEVLEVLDENSGYTYFEGGFNGNYLAFAAADADQSILAVIDGNQKKQTVGLASENSFHVKTDENGIYVQINQILVQMDPATGEQIPLANMEERIRQFAVGDEFCAAAADGKILIFNSEAELVTEIPVTEDPGLLAAADGVVLTGRIDTPQIHVLKYEEHPEAEILKYDAAFEHAEARVSASGKHVMLFSYQQFRIYNMDGTAAAEETLPDAEHVYDQQYIREGDCSYLEVTYGDGRLRVYDADNGNLVSEAWTEVPDMTLNEEFCTESFRIEAPLHGRPQVYDMETGQKLYELDEEAYLTYVTQVGDSVIVQYVNAEGECYGVLLNAEGEPLAELPYLCDIAGDELYFDYPSGDIRKSGIYDLDELLEIAESEMD